MVNSKTKLKGRRMKSKNATTADRALQKSKEADRPSKRFCAADACKHERPSLPILIKDLKAVRKCSETGVHGKMIYFHSSCF
jgi:hypothetical protein